MPETTLWPLGEHTAGKHLVLGEYLKAWLPILGMTHPRIVFIDGFAGPGEYEGGEPGSPIVAIRAFRDHTAAGRFRAQVVFLLVESDPARADHLRGVLGRPDNEPPPNAAVHVVTGRFDETIVGQLDQIESAGQRLAPVFLMVDPFGISGTPMSVIHRLLRHDRAEVYVSFMYEAIGRFRGTPEFERHLDALFGCPNWRVGIDMQDSDDRKRFFYDLYRSRLRVGGAQHVVNFELYQGNRLVYTIFFATKHPLGCDRMKQAIWKVAPFGDFAFRGGRGGQLGLELDGTDLSRLSRELRSAFASKNWVTIEELEGFVQSDQTDFHSGHLKGLLRDLERDGEIGVNPLSRKKRGTFPRGTRLRFTPPAADNATPVGEG